MELFDLIKMLTPYSENTLIQGLPKLLSKYYKKNKIKTTENFILVTGDIPIALTVHLDTVFNTRPCQFFYDSTENVMWSPQGLGADDRAGLAAIFQLLMLGYRPHLILTTKEEVGGVGAQFLIRAYNKSPFPQLKYIIELDRRGANDCVFYDCDNAEFEEYVQSFGFSTNIGTFSDISIICPIWGIAGVNLSVGYMNEHSVAEHLYLSYLKDTINKVGMMLDDAQNSKKFKYEKSGIYKYYSNYSTMDIVCDNCGLPTDYFDTVLVKTEQGTRSLCYNCFAQVKDISLCPQCNEWYITRPNKNCCKDCEEKSNNGNNRRIL